MGSDPIDGGLEQDGGGGAVHVVVAVDEDRLAESDGLLDAVYGAIHAEHEVGWMEVVERGVEEGFGDGGGGDAAGDEEVGYGARAAEVGGEVADEIRVGGSEG